MWIHDNPTGLLKIRSDGQDRYLLEIDGVSCGSFETPEEAAEKVACFQTGYYDWDSLRFTGCYFPETLDDWDEYKAF